jgi:arylsulfotransferase ASST
MEAADAPGLDGGTPSLVALSVSSTVTADAAADAGGDASAPIELVPPFTPDVHDYYVQCGAGMNALTVSMEASPGARSLLTQPVPSAALPKQTLSLTVNEGQAIVAAATDGTATEEYWVRCLPHDFPPLQMNLHPEAGVPTPGYYLIGNAITRNGAGYAMVLDSRGVPVWYYRTAEIVFNVDSVIPGTISFYDPAAYEIDQLAPPSTTTLPSLIRSEHELRVLPDGGDYLLITSPLTTGIDLTGMSLPLPDGGSQPLGEGGTIEDCVIDQIDSSGTIVWYWIASEHLDSVKDCTFPQAALNLALPDGGVAADPFHCNSIDVDPTTGNLLVSARHMDSVFYIDKSTKTILWKMGGNAFTKDGATFIPVSVSDQFYRQHDARLQPGWSACTGGQITLFDDETMMPGLARAVVYDVSFGPGDGGTGGDCGTAGDGGTAQATVAWQYAGTSSSVAMGSFRILDDGSRVVGWGFNSVNHTAFSEVDDAGNDLLDFNMDYANVDGTYRAIKVPLDAGLDLSVLRSTSGNP